MSDRRIPPVTRPAAVLIAASHIYAVLSRDGIPTVSIPEAVRRACQLAAEVEKNPEAFRE